MTLTNPVPYFHPGLSRAFRGILLILLLTLLLFAPSSAAPPDAEPSNSEKPPAMFKGPRTIVYYVPDLNSAKAWFADAFGIEPYFDEPFYVGINVGGYELGLLPFDDDWKDPISITYWGVDDIDTAYKTMLEKGGTEVPKGAPQAVGEQDGKKLMVACVRNPMGNLVGLIDNPFFKIDPE